MSKLQELIQRLCPDGVEYKPLGEVGTFTRGNGLQKKDFTESGVGCIHYGQIYTYYGILAYETKSFVSSELSKKLLKVNPGDLVIACTSENVEDVGKAVAWLGKSEIVTGGHSVVFRHTLNPKYVAYFFQTQMFFSQKKRFAYGAKVIDIRTNDLARIVIPVPPLEVQEEIVKILDRFADYAAELQAELQARKQQYEYYRNLLLTFNPSACGFGTDDEQQMNVTAWGGDSYKIHWKKMGEIGTFYGGLTGKSKEDFSDGNEAFISYMNVFSNIAVDTERGDKVRISPNERQNTVQYGDALFTGSSETREECGMSSVLTRKTSKKLYLNSFCFGFRLNNPEIYNPEFLKHLLRSNDVRSQIIRTANGVTRFNVSKKLFANIFLPIPPMEVQERIVAVLDRFETLVNDLNEGLPREVELRRKQYEHYRDRLLSFPDISRRDTKQRI